MLLSGWLLLHHKSFDWQEDLFFHLVMVKFRIKFTNKFSVPHFLFLEYLLIHLHFFFKIKFHPLLFIEIH
jgi:hypothetical protein